MFGTENIIAVGVASCILDPVPYGLSEVGLLPFAVRLGIPSRVMRHLGGKIVYGGGGEYDTVKSSVFAGATVV